VTELLKRELGVETNLVEGDRGEFTVWVDEQVVARKGRFGFPEDMKVLEAVREALTTRKAAGHGS
jgi:predicted Rdx family selenoprotein